MKRYALLDTDFISKKYSVQDDGGNHLIDRVMELPEARRLQRIPCRQVLQEIFDGKFIELKNGMLRYKR